jgi:multiple sugar transport system permease protein
MKRMETPQSIPENELRPYKKRLTHDSRWTLTNRQREALWFYIIISPWILGFLVLLAGPMVYSFYLSFTEWDLFTAPQFVGFDNYIKLLTRDKVFAKTIYNTFYYAILSVGLNTVLSIIIAYFLNKRLFGMRFFRTAIYIPSVVPVVAMSMVFTWIFAPDTGLLNQFLANFGIDGPAWLLSADWVKLGLVVMSLWGVGGSIILLLTGLQGIPVELYEAAAIDGATETDRFFKITLPLLSPVIFFNLVMGIIGSLQTFAQVFILTGGGPNNTSQMMVPYLFDNAFRFFKMGYASAIAWILFVIILALTLLVMRWSSVWVFYENEVKS